MTKLKYKDWDCQVKLANYMDNGRLAIMLVSDDEIQEPIAKATVNVPEHKLGENEVVIKTYSENAGMDEALIKAGIVEPEPVTHIPVGFCVCPVMKLTDEFVATIH